VSVRQVPEDARVIEALMFDPRRRVGGDEKCGDAQAEELEVVLFIVRIGWRRGGREDVVIESSVLVEGDDEQRPLPARRVAADAVVDLREEPLAVIEVAGWVVVVLSAERKIARLNERVRGEVLAVKVGAELADVAVVLNPPPGPSPGLALSSATDCCGDTGDSRLDVVG